jgi:phosphoribosylformylglycinamidine synthase
LLPEDCADPIAYLFAEEPGVVVQIARADLATTKAVLAEHDFAEYRIVAAPNTGDDIAIGLAGRELYRRARVELHALWSTLTYKMQALRDHPECADEAIGTTLDERDPGLNAVLTFDMPTLDARPTRADRPRPKVAILREQGVNGQREMAAAFDRAGFDCYDVHMSDLLEARVTLTGFNGLVACGGFSYGDVLGAGEGWAKSILYNERLHEAFSMFFGREDSFALGVCNGCQMLAALKSLIPGTEHWPRFLRNRSDQFEGRLSLVGIEASPSILLRDMAGSRLPVVTSHGEGRAEFTGAAALDACEQHNTALRYVGNGGAPAERYPANPNGSPHGIAGLCNDDGRITVMMPHPERVFRTVQHSWHPKEWGECSPWQRLFDNARAWVDCL